VRNLKFLPFSRSDCEVVKELVRLLKMCDSTIKQAANGPTNETKNAPNSGKALNVVGLNASGGEVIDKNIEVTGVDASGENADKKFKTALEDYKSVNVTAVDGSNCTLKGGDIKATGLKF
jgi:hypothetical protein